MAIDLTILSMSVLIFIRNFIVGKVQLRRIEEIHATYLALIENNEFDSLLDYETSKRSYGADLFDLRKWTYKQFYPEVP